MGCGAFCLWKGKDQVYKVKSLAEGDSIAWVHLCTTDYGDAEDEFQHQRTTYQNIADSKVQVWIEAIHIIRETEIRPSRPAA